MADDFGNGEDVKVPVGKAAVNRLIRENSDIFSDSQCKVCSAVLISESQKLAHYQSKKHANKYRRYLSIHEGEDFTPAKKMKVDDTENAGDDADRNKCCPVCNMTFSSPVVAMSHYLGKTHSKNLKMKEQGGAPQGVPAPKGPKSAPAPARVPPEDADKSDRNKFCQLCSATFNNPHMAEQHYKGRRHLKQETKSKLMTIYSSHGNTLPQSVSVKPQTPGSGAIGNWLSCDTCNVVLNSIEQYQAHVSGYKHKHNLTGKTTTYSDTRSPALKRKFYERNTPSDPLPFSGATSSYTDFRNTPSNPLPFSGVSSSYNDFCKKPSDPLPFSGVSSSYNDFRNTPSDPLPFSGVSSSYNDFRKTPSNPLPFSGVSSSYTDFRNTSSKPLSYSGAPSSYTDYSSSSGGLSNYSYSGSFSSSYGPSKSGSLGPGEGLLPLPSYGAKTQRPYMKSTMGSDDYNYFRNSY
ncbi:zinc finger protein 346 isoform 2-T2 [Anomaloglossus baeobatrachus]|uniref:zinc finger protein 346 isoform X2 n=1 Tax=Anomaloglossus baeobatrachus TaxID=238106 RepID=UPI003F5012C2